MQDVITRAAAAADEYLKVPLVGPVLALNVWAQSMPAVRGALREDTATTDELLKEAEEFDTSDKHYPLRAALQFQRLRNARRAGR